MGDGGRIGGAGAQPHRRQRQAAEAQGCDWVLIDRDEPPSDQLPRFD